MTQRRLITEQHIAAVWQAHGLGAVRRIAVPAGGSRNESYIVNDELFVRFNTLDPGFAKFGSEAVAYRLLRSGDLPTPRVVALDESRQLVPYDYIVLTLVAGRSIASSTDLSAAQRQALAEEAGRMLAQLHGITFPAFGMLNLAPRFPFATWPDYFRDYALRYMQPALDRALITPATFDQLQALLDRESDVLACVTPGSLVHSDYHYENILQQDGRISGLLDFEWTFSGDPSADFIAAPSRERQMPGCEPTLLAGYTSVRPLDPDHARRMSLYTLFLHLETAVAESRLGRAATAQAALAAMKSLF